jgi:salicylate hydroxylase
MSYFQTSASHYSSANSSHSVLETLLRLLPSTVKTEFSSHISDAENIEATADRPAFVRLTIEPSQRHHHPDWPGQTRTFEADAVIACDGVKSVLRQCIGAHGTDGRVTRYTGTYAYRGLLNMKKAVEANGESVRTPQMWYGHKTARLYTCETTLLYLRRIYLALPLFSNRTWHNTEHRRLRFGSLERCE